jgi:hypothetical protein
MSIKSDAWINIPAPSPETRERIAQYQCEPASCEITVGDSVVPFVEELLAKEEIAKDEA